MEQALEISVQEAQDKLQARSGAVIVDVREPDEFALAHIRGSELIPMQDVPSNFQRLERLADEKPLLVLCHHGVRSLHVVSWLRTRGLDNCYSVSGGIDLWSREIDASIPRY
jgi:rhodanese-related sulfurtransferase